MGDKYDDRLTELLLITTGGPYNLINSKNAFLKLSLLKINKKMNVRTFHVAAIIILLAFISSCKTKTEIVESEQKVEKQSIFKKLQENNQLSVSETIDLYQKLKKESPNLYNFESEQELNKLGYAYLSEGKINSAIEIFKLLVAEFPQSSNPYDSLGEAYKEAGNDKLAILNYEKSVQLNPKNNHAKDQLTILKGLELLVTDWGKEFFHFPLHFAEDIPYLGVEEVVFPKNWIKPDSTDFWSYVFVWALENKNAVTAKELEDNLTLYFDGLIGGLSRTDSTKLTKASVHLEDNVDAKDSIAFFGHLNIFDGFATQTPLTLNARIYSEYCPDKDQLFLLFRFSPLPFNHQIWNKLRTVQVRKTICKE